MDCGARCKIARESVTRTMRCLVSVGTNSISDLLQSRDSTQKGPNLPFAQTHGRDPKALPPSTSPFWEFSPTLAASNAGFSLGSTCHCIFGEALRGLQREEKCNRHMTCCSCLSGSASGSPTAHRPPNFCYMPLYNAQDYLREYHKNLMFKSTLD